MLIILRVRLESDSVKHKLRVTSCELRVEGFNAQFEIQKNEFKSTNSNSRVAISTLRVQIRELPVYIYEL